MAARATAAIRAAGTCSWHTFDPTTDLKRNTDGVIEFSGTKPDLERAFDRYFRTREEDVNTLT